MMKDLLTYKGFIGSVHFSADDQVSFGKIEGFNDLVTFEGKAVKELVDAFHHVVDEHINDCEKENIPVEKSYKGSFNIRPTPDLHRRLSVTAKMKGVSLNQLIHEALAGVVYNE